MCGYDDSNSVKSFFIYGNGTESPQWRIDEVLLMKDEGNDYYYAHDHLYSPAALIDSSGTILERYEYDAYGDCSILEPNFAPDPDGKSDYGNPYLFTGRRLDILDNGGLKMGDCPRFPGVEAAGQTGMNNIAVKKTPRLRNIPLQTFSDLRYSMHQK